MNESGSYQQPYQKIDRSQWTIEDYIREGETITWEAQPTEVLQSRNTFIVGDIHDHFIIWYLSLKEQFLPSHGYLDPSNPMYLKASLINEAGKVPRLRKSAIEISGEGYGEPYSTESKELIEAISSQTSSILKILRELTSPSSVWKARREIYLDRTKGIYVQVNGKDIYYPRIKPHSKIFKALILLAENSEGVELKEIVAQTKQNLAHAKRAFKDFNKNAKKHFDIKEDVILTNTNGLYYLNPNFNYL